MLFGNPFCIFLYDESYYEPQKFEEVKETSNLTE